MSRRAELDKMIELWGGDLGWEYDGDIYIAQRLMFHYALLINSNEYGHEQRYCYKDLRLIELAAKEQRKTGKLRYWHKDHTKNESVVKNYLFPAGAFHDDTNQAIGKVNWSTEHTNEAHITCPKCDITSHNSGDVENEYCATCGYHADLTKDQKND